MRRTANLDVRICRDALATSRGGFARLLGVRTCDERKLSADTEPLAAIDTGLCHDK